MMKGIGRTLRKTWYTGVMLSLLASPLAGGPAAVEAAAPARQMNESAGQSYVLTDQHRIMAVVAQPDGKLVAAGAYNKQTLVVRFTREGELDPTFDGDGIVIANLTSGDERAEAVVLQPDGKIVAAGWATHGNGDIDIGVLRLNANGTFDDSFDSNGVLTVDFDDDAALDNSTERALAVALQPDGRILLGGRSNINDCGTLYCGISENGYVVRLTAAGKRDASFGSSGAKVLVGHSWVNAVAVQPDGRILAGGAGGGYRVSRLSAAGAQEMDFGYFATPLSGAGDMLMVPGGGYLVYDTSRIGRYTANGEAVMNFGDKGIADVPGGMRVRGVYLQPNNTIVAVGDQVIDPNTDLTRFRLKLARLHLNNGTPDLLFGEEDGGVVEDALGTGIESSFVIELAPVPLLGMLPDGHFRLLAKAHGRSDQILARFYPDGAGEDGSRQLHNLVPKLGDSINDMVLLPDGKLGVVGTVESGTGSTARMYVGRFTSDGSLDAALGVSEPLSYGAAAAVDAQGRLVAAGALSSTTTSGLDLLLRRLNEDGSASEFQPGLLVVVTDLGGQELPRAAAVQPDGKILVAGTSDDALFAVRFLPNGTLDAGFGDGGVVKLAPADPNGKNSAEALAVMPDGRILLAGATEVAGTVDQNILVVRLTAEGKPDGSFAQDGVLVLSPSLGYDSGNAVSFSDDGKILVGGSGAVDGHNQFLLYRLEDDGAPDTSFGTGGVARADFGVDARVTALLREPDGGIMLGGCALKYQVAQTALARFDAAGKPLAAFFNNGKTSLQFGMYGECSNALANTAEGLVLGGYAFVQVDGLWDGQFALARLRWTDKVNRAPAAGPAAFATSSGATLTVSAPAGLRRSASDPDGTAVITLLAAGPAHGTLLAFRGDGSFVYRPEPGFVGQDQMVYRVTDGAAFSAGAVVTIDVLPEVVDGAGDAAVYLPVITR